MVKSTKGNKGANARSPRKHSSLNPNTRNRKSLLEVILPEKNEEHKHQIGRYWASDIYSIRKGYLTPKNYFDEKPLEPAGATNIFFGVALENLLKEKIPDFKTQNKYELKITDDIVLVVKPDFEDENIVVECKCPTKPLYEISEKYADQLECEFRATSKPTYLLSFQRPTFKLFKYNPNEKRWAEIVDVLKNFHNKLLKTN
jgi:hypothetical protein